ncbi:MAG: hypothetical protein J7L78_01075, partial [Dehalococcoidales bacterium]|nr:hypothetical protein [Dehalococcoidales bacterium]
PFDRGNKQDLDLLEKLCQAADIAGKQAFQEGIFRKRPNEVGNDIEPYVKAALKTIGLQADTPITQGQRRQAMGYPDIEVIDSYGRITYLECKTYNLANIGTTQRAFYFSPSKEGCKVTADARHLVMSFQIEMAQRRERQAYIPVHWRIYNTDSMVVQVKHEFNASNRQMYRQEALLAEGSI